MSRRSRLEMFNELTRSELYQSNQWFTHHQVAEIVGCHPQSAKEMLTSYRDLLSIQRDGDGYTHYRKKATQALIRQRWDRHLNLFA